MSLVADACNFVYIEVAGALKRALHDNESDDSESGSQPNFGILPSYSCIHASSFILTPWVCGCRQSNQ